MKINAAGLALLKQFEGCKLKAYPDPGSGGDPWTIGYGSTGPDVVKGLVITQQEAEERLASDLARFEEGVEALLTADVSENAFSALVCFAFNVGLRNLKSSALLRLVNGGDFAAAAAQFARWNKAQGRVLAGLTKRRAAESQLFQA